VIDYTHVYKFDGDVVVRFVDIDGIFLPSTFSLHNVH